MKSLALFCLALLLSLAGVAHAERTALPAMNFEHVPVSLSTGAKLTSDEVKQALMAACRDLSWEVVPSGDGQLRATAFRNGKHTVVISIRFEADNYSVIYESSDNMNANELRHRPEEYLPTYRGEMTVASEAARKQRALFADRPETPYGRPDFRTALHPAYEQWIHDLLDAIRLKLQRAHS